MVEGRGWMIQMTQKQENTCVAKVLRWLCKRAEGGGGVLELHLQLVLHCALLLANMPLSVKLFMVCAPPACFLEFLLRGKCWWG